MNRIALSLAFSAVIIIACTSTRSGLGEADEPTSMRASHGSVPTNKKAELVRVEGADPEVDLSEYHPAEVLSKVGPMGATRHLMSMPSPYKGTVTLEVEVRENGTVAQVRVANGLDPIFDREASKAVRQWRFRPTTSPLGEPVASWMLIEIHFRKR